MLPCCGHFLIANEELDNVVILGCPNGIDWAIKHNDDTIDIELEDAIGKDGTDYSGVYAVEDRGGAITNNKLDIYMNTYNECIQFGRRNIECYIYVK